MRTEIIEILQSKYPEYCMQHIDTANEILRLFGVSGSLPLPKCKCGQNTLPYKAQIEINKCSRCGNAR